MAFYSPDPSMGEQLERLIRALELESGAGYANRLSITWLRYGRSLPEGTVPALAGPARAAWPAEAVLGASWAGGRPMEPGRLVALVALVAVEVWLQQQWIEDSPELRRTLQLLVADGGEDAFSQVIDLLTGTTSGPSLPPERFAAWQHQRQLLNAWLARLGWPELDQANVSQKLWRDGPFGRERDGLGPGREHGNRLCSDALARLLQAVMGGTLLSPPASLRLQRLLAYGGERPRMPGGLSAGVPEAARVWGLAHQGAGQRHEVAYVEMAGMAPCLLVVLSEGGSGALAAGMLPWLAAQMVRHAQRI